MLWSGSSDKTPRKTESQSNPSDSSDKDASPKNPPAKEPEQSRLDEALGRHAQATEPDDGSAYEAFVEGYAPDSTETNIRYAAYTTRIRTILLSTHRYVAYTSDIGESFRPVAHRNLVRTAYGISWLYILGDVGYEGYRSYLHNERVRHPAKELTERQQEITGLETKPDVSAAVVSGTVPPLQDYRTVMVQRAIFQSIASMGLPALTIHSIVRYSGRAMKDLRSKTVRTWAPIGLGLAIVPFLPALYDHPVENAVEWVFHKGFEMYGGKSYVGDAPSTGREKELGQKPGKKNSS